MYQTTRKTKTVKINYGRIRVNKSPSGQFNKKKVIKISKDYRKKEKNSQKKQLTQH